MRRFSILLLAAMAVGAHAQQGAPPDVPRNHWAFEAVDTLFREGLLKGYPDGTFKGSRPLSRYEMAAVLSGVNRKLLERLDAIKAGTVKTTPQERADLEAQVRALRLDIDSLKPMRTEIGALTERLTQMRSQLHSIRGDVGEMRKQVDEAKNGK